MFGRKQREIEAQERLYYTCKYEWYFDIEYLMDTACYSTHIQFESLREAEYWVKTSSSNFIIIAVTDRAGNRIITDWSGNINKNELKVWIEIMKKKVFDFRSKKD